MILISEKTLDDLERTAANAVEFVGMANYQEREDQALQRVSRAFELAATLR